MPVPTLRATPDIKEPIYNPFLDGTVRNRDIGGEIVPVSTGSTVDLPSQTPTQPRPSRASAAGRLDNAVRAARTGTVKENAKALRGWALDVDHFDTDAFEGATDILSPKELEGLSDGLANLGNAKAPMRGVISNRQAIKGFIRQGSGALGALGTAVDLATVGAAVLDPNNQPYGEIGDVAGSIIGGALGTPFGPVGVFAGSIIGGYIGAAIGNAFEGGNTPTVSAEGAPPFTGGQSPGVQYRVLLNRVSDTGGKAGGRYGGTFGNPIIGPVSSVQFVSSEEASANAHVRITHGGGTAYHSLGTAWDGGSRYGNDPHWQGIADIRVERKDGQPDTGGNPKGTPTPTRTRPHYPKKPNGQPFTNPGPSPAPVKSPEPQPQPSPQPQPQPQPKDPLGERGPGLDGLPGPDDLPEPGDNKNNPDGPSPNPPEQKCCPGIMSKLEEILELLNYEYKDIVDISACGVEEDGSTIEWRGTGIDGVIQAANTISRQLEIIHTNTKCGSEAAPLPMLWEVKSTQVPQLVVVWARVEGGSSRWSMHIPHPKESINNSFNFRFPDYTKGNMMATLRLKDNTKVIVNGKDKENCLRIVDYIKETIIDSEYTEENTKLTFTEGVANFVEVDVSAKYVTAFDGNKGDPPLWAKTLL